MGTTGNTKKGKNQSKMEKVEEERRNMTNRELAEEDNRDWDDGGT